MISLGCGDHHRQRHSRLGDAARFGDHSGVPAAHHRQEPPVHPPREAAAERLDAYSAYAGALVNYRRCLVHLWFCEHEQPPPEDPDTVRIRAYDLRSNAQEALFRVQMLTDDETLSRSAEDVLADVTALSKTDSRTELGDARVRTRDDISRLVRAAKQHL